MTWQDACGWDLVAAGAVFTLLVGTFYAVSLVRWMRKG
jgi:hypothetical protein